MTFCLSMVVGTSAPLWLWVGLDHQTKEISGAISQFRLILFGSS